MAGPALDELVGWSEDARGRLNGIVGARRGYRVSALSRFLLPGLGRDFAAEGDVIEVETAPFAESHVAGVTNVTRRSVRTADPLRAALCGALLFACPFPLIALRDGLWLLLFFSAAAAAAFLYMLLGDAARLRKGVSEERAAWTLSVWRLLRGKYVTGLPPGMEYSDEPEPEWLDVLDRAYAGALDNHEVVEIGSLPVPDGKLLACEPFRIHDPRPCIVPVPPGTYPVFISVAASPKSPDQRIAYAWVRLRDGVPARWEAARTRGGAEVSVGVDSGMAGFVSAAAAPAFIAAYRMTDHGYKELLSQAITEAMEPVWRSTRGWAVVEAEGGARLAAFSSGFGDGTYPVYRAIDARGRRLAVAINFYVSW